MFKQGFLSHTNPVNGGLVVIADGDEFKIIVVKNPEFFPGNVCNGMKKTQIKIHALYDFTNNSFPLLNVHTYTDGDQSIAGNVLPYLNPGDLILRDLGFQNLTVQKELIQQGNYFFQLFEKKRMV